MRHLQWGCLERRRKGGGGIQSRRNSVPKKKVQETRLSGWEQQGVPLARSMVGVVGSGKSQVVKGLLCNMSILHPGKRGH